MKKCRTTKSSGSILLPVGRLTVAVLALTATTTQAVNYAVSTQQVETVVNLVSNPLPTIPGPSAQGYILLAGKVECDEGSAVLKLGGEEAPGLTLIFHEGEVQLVADGMAPSDVTSTQGKTGVFDFRLSIRHLAQPVRICTLETRKQGAEFQIVSQMMWPTPLLPSQDPMSWLVTGAATAGVAGKCEISHFSIKFLVPPTLFMWK